MLNKNHRDLTPDILIDFIIDSIKIEELLFKYKNYIDLKSNKDNKQLIELVNKSDFFSKFKNLDFEQELEKEIRNYILDENINEEFLYIDELEKIISDELKDKLIKIEKESITFIIKCDLNLGELKKIFSKLKYVSFNFCKFEIESINKLFIDSTNIEISFYSCEFSNIWFGIKSKNLIHYNSCTFNEYNHNGSGNEKFDLLILFWNCEFKVITMDSLKLGRELFKYDKFYNKSKIIENIEVNRCIFDKTISIESQFIINNLSFINSIFKSKVKLKNILFSNSFNLFNSTFKDLADFQHTVFNKVNFTKADFEGITVFTDTNFNKFVEFKYVKFLELSIFREAYFYDGLDLKDTIFKRESNFLDIHKDMELKVNNRETARIIKNSFEQQNNIIEANKFYALEMKKYDEEITWKKNFKEKLIFKLHDWSSGHSQNWLLPLFWILILSCGYGLYQDFFLDKCISNYYPIISKIIGYILVFLSFSFIVDNIIENKKLKNYSLPFIFVVVGFYFLITNDLLLELPAKAINPFSVMNDSDNINGVQLVFKITIAYLIYQLIISIRQNTRRK